MKRWTVVLSLLAVVQAQASLFEDDFDRAWDQQMTFIDYKAWADGQAASIGQWDGFLGSEKVLVAYNYLDGFPYSLGELVAGNKTPNPSDPTAPELLNGVLLISSRDSGWDAQRNTGAFLYENITGDFLAEVEIVSRDYWWKQAGGLMVRAENPSLAIESERWLALSHSPVDQTGNQAISVADGIQETAGTTGYPTDAYLQLERRGDTFYLRTSEDGIHWTSLPGLEGGLVRGDLPETLQVGIWQASQSNLLGTMMFDNFIVVPEPATIALLGIGGLALVCLRRP